jgi:flagellar L-ring protein precursor FlgH
MDLSGVEVGSEGTGTAAQANTLTGVITAMVTEVMPNGNLIVEGRKQLSLTEGAEFVQVRGIVRARDIQADNTIPSMRMAQAQISYRGTGNLAESTQPGWLSQLIFKYWPL